MFYLRPKPRFASVCAFCVTQQRPMSPANRVMPSCPWPETLNDTL